jgi:hypothetical protein
LNTSRRVLDLTYSQRLLRNILVLLQRWDTTTSPVVVGMFQ